MKANIDVFLGEQPPRQNQYYLEPLEMGYARLLPLGPYWQEIVAEADKELAEIILNGRAAKDGLEAAARACDEILLRWASQ